MTRRHRLTRAALSIGVVASFALCGAHRLAADEPSYNDLRQNFESAYRDKDYAKALECSKKLHEMRPEDTDHIYNIACMNCLLGNEAEAYKWLDKLADAGYDDADYLVKDDDFKSMRDDERFKKIVSRMRGERPVEKEKEVKKEKEPEHKIIKLNEGKPKKQDAPLSAEDHAKRIQELTQELGNVSGKDKKKALEMAMEAHEHALALKRMLDAEPNASDRTRQFVDANLGLTAYNVACMYSLLDKKDEAFDYLKKSIDHKSFTNNIALQIVNDTDLDNLRSDARYADIMKKLGVDTAKPGANASKPEARFSDDNLPKVEKMSPNEHGQAFERCTQQLVTASKEGKRDDALQLARKALAHAKALMDFDNTNPRIQHAWALGNYNTACMYSLNKDADAAFFYLNRAIDAGGWGVPLATAIQGDDDFDNIRHDDRYQPTLEHAKKVDEGGDASESAEPKEETVEPQFKVTLPKNYDADKAAPLIVALHHFSGNMDTTTDRWKKAASDVGAILLTPQGTVKMGDGVYQWGRDIDTIERNVMKAIDQVMDKHKVDQKKIVLAGYSQGGWATWAIAAHNPDTFRGIIPVCGSVFPDTMKDLESDDVGHLRAWIMVGGEENADIIDANKKAEKLLKKAGAKVHLAIYEGVGHNYPKNSDEELSKALHFILD